MKLNIFNTFKFFLRILVLFFILTHMYSWLLYIFAENLKVTKELMQSDSVSQTVLLRASVAFLPIVVIASAWSGLYWSKRVFVTAFLLSLLYFQFTFSVISPSLPFYLIPLSCLALGKGFTVSVWKKKEK